MFFSVKWKLRVEPLVLKRCRRWRESRLISSYSVPEPSDGSQAMRISGAYPGRRGQRVAVVAVIIDAVEDVELAAEGEHRRAARADGARLKRIGQIKIVNPQAAANRGGKEVVLSEPAAPQPLDRAGRREQLAVPLALFQRAVRQNLEVAHVRAEGQPVADRQQLVVARKLRRLMLFHRPFVTMPFLRI